MQTDIETISILELFGRNDRYLIPVYQRNYAWREEQIEALLEDIKGNANDNYYLGTLVVSKKRERDNTYEVIDGQQRLTTLFLLFKALHDKKDEKIKFDDSCLQFEARDISNRLLHSPESDIFSEEGHEISVGYKIIQAWLHKHFNNAAKDDFIKKLEKTIILRIPVPEHTDLNHYFEIMNTRGEQLELHEVAKGRLIDKLRNKQINDNSSVRIRNIAALIWDACADMSRYIQTCFHADIRGILFGADWNSFKCGNFDDIVKKWPGKNADNNSDQKDSEGNFLPESLEAILLKDNLKNFALEEGKKASGKQDDGGNYDSIIRFPDFLLHVNLILKEESGEEDEKKLDDKELLNHLEGYWSDADEAGNFIYNLLKYRYYFDKYIIKRDYSGKQEGEWSLKRYEKYEKDEKRRGREINLLSSKEEQDELSELNRQLLTLESCCRITYTSPNTMYWITEILKEIQNDESSNEKEVAKKLISVLEDYCVGKLKKTWKKGENNPFGTGFDISRIVFSYLDYLLYRDGYKDGDKEIVTKQDRNGFDFKFRNSIEHFSPQNPADGTKPLEDRLLHNLGNLALITGSGNSRLSNLSPKSKVNEYEGKKKDVISQSLKLKVMADIAKKEGWGEDQITAHNKEMLAILEKAIKGPDVNQQAG